MVEGAIGPSLGSVCKGRSQLGGDVVSLWSNDDGRG